MTLDARIWQTASAQCQKFVNGIIRAAVVHKDDLELGLAA